MVITHDRIMGPTGSGKSSFINTITGRPVRETGGDLESTTEDAECEHMVLNGVPVTLIDTPGFDDTYLTEAQVLRKISSYLIEMYEENQKLTGVLYLRDIHEKKMKGSEKRNIDLFFSLCGEKYLSNVRLVTTKWDDDCEAVDAVEGREAELREKFWAHMERLGCRYSKYFNTQASATGIVGQMLNLTPDYLQIQEELGEMHLSLGQTAAGQIIELGQKQRLSELRQRMKEVSRRMEQMRQSHNEALQQALEDQRADIEDEMEEMDEKNRILEQNYKSLLQKTQSPDTSFLLKQLMKRWDQKLPADITIKKVVGIGALGAVGVAGLVAATLD
ncbi:P-loop containing nucleoside triphosphate hydrolase protein [Mollisia scopiformis]|uniref:p-loop containing nucleoside triphosphate hydrolase protein n=1 Tax=Mollisia scopiformis TaxID=149040 RepID=A0A132BB52_MOLSC|nr:P-loop containing nucleoside triphosphate hydrolase protein [Mollisia scopiformis]KUJ09074.1 P-loop containing nucleoside triphosphate hydrolase protein [Mollisia scopiformis]